MSFDQTQVNRLAQEGNAVGLLEILERGDVGFACQAAIALAKLDERRAADSMLTRLRAIDLSSPTDGEVDQWRILADALGDVAKPGSPAADELLAVLEERDFQTVGWWAGQTLAEMGDRRAIPPLLNRLRTAAKSVDAEEDDSWDAVTGALGELRAVEAANTLIAALPVASMLKQEATAEALEKIGDPRAIPALIAALESHHGHFNPASNAIVNALHQFGTPEAERAVRAYDRSLL